MIKRLAEGKNEEKRLKSEGRIIRRVLKLLFVQPDHSALLGQSTIDHSSLCMY